MMYHDPIKPPQEVLDCIARNKIILPIDGLVLNRKDGTSAGHVNDRGYVCVTIRVGKVSKQIKRAHLIWYGHHGYWPISELDHEDRQPLNDRISNLKESTRALQMENTYTSLQRDLPRGVYKRQDPTMVDPHYCVQVRLKGKTVTLKYPREVEEATALITLAQTLKDKDPNITKAAIMTAWNQRFDIPKPKKLAPIIEEEDEES